MINWTVRIKNKNFWLAIIPALVLLVAAVITLLYVAPMRSLRRSLPVENIKSGK